MPGEGAWDRGKPHSKTSKFYVIMITLFNYNLSKTTFDRLRNPITSDRINPTKRNTLYPGIAHFDTTRTESSSNGTNQNKILLPVLLFMFHLEHYVIKLR